MKKFISIAAAIVCGAAALSFAACSATPAGGDDTVTTFSVYAPDGAPALALTSLLSEEDTAKGDKFDVHIVNATTIQIYVTGASPEADFCILPVNAAAKLLGSGTEYQMLGSVTNGNLYFLKNGTKELPDLTEDNLSSALLGKTLGVIQYEQVPGLTLRVVLEDYEIPYALVESNDDAAADKVNIRSLNATQVVPATGCDYYLCPEPARTTKIGATNGALLAAGSLQELYGGDGYPQAVLVAKNKVIQEHKAAVKKMVDAMEKSADYLKTAEASTLAALLESKRTAGMDPAFTEAQLNPTVIANCSVWYTKAKDCKNDVIEFLGKFKAVSPDSTAIPDDAFFYSE